MTSQALALPATGIASIGLNFPPLAMPVQELASLPERQEIDGPTYSASRG